MLRKYIHEWVTLFNYSIKIKILFITSFIIFLVLDKAFVMLQHTLSCNKSGCGEVDFWKPTFLASKSNIWFFYLLISDLWAWVSPTFTSSWHDMFMSENLKSIYSSSLQRKTKENVTHSTKSQWLTSHTPLSIFWWILQ